MTASTLTMSATIAEEIKRAIVMVTSSDLEERQSAVEVLVRFSAKRQGRTVILAEGGLESLVSFVLYLKPAGPGLALQGDLMDQTLTTLWNLISLEGVTDAACAALVAKVKGRAL